MPATLSTIVRPGHQAGARILSAFQRLLRWDRGYFVRRAAIASLHELDDRALRDIGLARSQIRRRSTVSSLFPTKARM